jgi:hypothetical protein
MAFGGKIGAPILKESTINIYDLLERYQPDNASEIKIDTTGGEIFLTYDTVFRYAMNELNFDFSVFQGNMAAGISNLFEGTPIGDILEMDITDDLKLTPENCNVSPAILYEYNINNDLQGSQETLNQKLDHIQFLNTDIVVTIEPVGFDIKTNTLLELSIRIPGITTPLTVKADPYKNSPYEYIPTLATKDFTVKAEGNFEFVFNMQGDNQTTVNNGSIIKCGIAFKSRDPEPRYVAFGWFNYTYKETQEKDNKKDTLMINLSDYIPGAEETVLNISDPQFTFDIQSSLGVPLKFGLDTIVAELLENKIEEFINKKDPFDIKAVSPNNVGDTISSVPILINNDFFAGSKKFSDFINTKLNSLKFSYHFGTENINLDQIELDKPTTFPGPMQFRASDSKLDVAGKLKVPLAFDEGSVICYLDTMDLDIDPESLEDVSSLELRFTYTNHLPIGFYIDLSLLDELHQNILGPDEVYQTVTLKEAEVNSEGLVDESKVVSLEYPLIFNRDTETSVIQLKDAKFLSFKYRSIPKDELLSSPPIQLKSTDYLSLKVTAVIDGQIIIK